MRIRDGISAGKLGIAAISALRRCRPELLRRGHEVRMAVPPDLVGFTEAAGLAAVAYGPDTQAVLDAYRNFWTNLFHNFWRIRDLIKFWREVWEPARRTGGRRAGR